MNSFGVAILCFFGGIVLIVVLLATAASLWASWDARNRVKTLLEQLEVMHKEKESDREELKRILESGKNVFQSIRAEIGKNLDATTDKTNQAFVRFEENFSKALKQLNGKALVESLPRVTAAVKRMEEVAMALHEVVTSAEEVRGTPAEWNNEARAEEHAPEGQSRIAKSIYDRIEEGETADEFDNLTGGLFK